MRGSKLSATSTDLEASVEAEPYSKGNRHHFLPALKRKRADGEVQSNLKRRKNLQTE